MDITIRLYTTQGTQTNCITFVQRRANVFDVGPTLYKCYTNIFCLPILLLLVHLSVITARHCIALVTVLERNVRYAG